MTRVFIQGHWYVTHDIKELIFEQLSVCIYKIHLACLHVAQRPGGCDWHFLHAMVVYWWNCVDQATVGVGTFWASCLVRGCKEFLRTFQGTVLEQVTTANCTYQIAHDMWCAGWVPSDGCTFMEAFLKKNERFNKRSDLQKEVKDLMWRITLLQWASLILCIQTFQW